MVEGGDRPRFLLEAAEAVGIGGDVVGQDLDRDVAPEARVPRAVHLPHAAGPEKLDDLVRPETGSCRESHEAITTSARPSSRGRGRRPASSRSRWMHRGLHGGW